MNKTLALVIAILCFVSCNSSVQERTVVTDSVPKKDSIRIIPEADLEDINLDSVLKDVIAEFSAREKIDSIFIVGTDIFSIKFEHYCLFDSAIRLDRHYTAMYNLDSFVAHNFVSDLLLIKNGNIILQTRITKELFMEEADSTLMKFGALRSPTFKFSDNKFSFHYSFTIPLTDVGVGVACTINLKGDLLFEHI